MDIKINIEKNNVVTGRSILSSSAKLLDTTIENCTYLEFRTFCDFLESVVLYDDVYIIGNFNSKESNAKDLMLKLNEINDNKFIHILKDSNDKFVINGLSVGKEIKKIVENTFGKKISFVRKQLLPKNFIFRYNDDEKTNFLNKISIALDKENKVEEISTIITDLYKENTNSEFIRHLLRAFEIAAVASVINGSAKFTGSRKPLGLLIYEKNKKIKLKTLTKQIYGYANSLYIAKQSTNKDAPYFQTLLLSIFLNKIKTSTDYLETIIEIRKEFDSFRNNFSQKGCISKKKIDKYNKDLYKTLKYYSEIYRLSSNSNFKNLLQKYSKELFLDEQNINIEYEYTDDEIKDNDSTTANINLTKIAKNSIKFIRDFSRNILINRRNAPLTRYFVEFLNSDSYLLQNDLFSINEFQKNKFFKFDLFLKKYNLM